MGVGLSATNPEPLPPAAQIGLNYLGRFAPELDSTANPDWQPARELIELSPGLHPDMPSSAAIEISALVADGEDGPRLNASCGRRH